MVRKTAHEVLVSKMNKVRRDDPFAIKIGDWTIWPLNDGRLQVDPRQTFDLEPDLLHPALLQAGCAEDATLPMQVHCYLMAFENHLILVDTGGGSHFGNEMGFLTQKLLETGHRPSQISAVLLTHCHLDHIGGLLTPDGMPAFSAATLYLSQEEANFWYDPAQEARANETNRAWFPLVRQSLDAYKGRLRPIDPEEVILPGVTAVNAYGHTPGHTAFLVSSNNERLLLWGDLVHLAELQFLHPEWRVKVDTDADQAVASRKRLFEMASDEQLMVGGAHLPYTGLGHVSCTKEGFAWEP